MEQQSLIESGTAQIAESLGFGAPQDDRDMPADAPDVPDGESEPDAPPVEGSEGEPPPENPDEQATPSEGAMPPPQSWAKDKHEVWAKMPKEAQEYYVQREEQMLRGLEQYKEYHGLGRSMKEVITPYLPMIQAAGHAPEKAVAVLLNANYRLTQGPIETRKQAFLELGASLGLIPQQNAQQEPPAVREMRERLARLEGSLTQREQQQFEEARTRVTAQVSEFAKTAPYFDEVAEEVVAFINAGHELKDAYDKAVYANPRTRAKELARLQKEAEAKIRSKAKAEVGEARKSTAANVRGRDTTRAPTEPLGKMEDTMRETLREIKSRTH